MKHSHKKNFIDSITGLCSVDVVGERDSWNVMLTGDYWEWDPAWFQSHTRGPIVPTCPLSVTLTDEGGYRHWFNPLFDGLPWLIDVPMVASEWIGFVPEDAEYLLAAWTAKYAKQHNDPKDPNYDRQTPIFIQTDPQNVNHVPGPYATPSWITIIDAGRTFMKPAGFSKWTMIEVPAEEPDHVTQNVVSFSEPPRPREDVTPGTPGGDGGGAAKTQIKEEDFVPAELPSESEWRFWEDKINASIDDYKREREVFRLNNPDDVYNSDIGQPIVRQDRHGNPVGQNFNTVKRTTTSAPQRRMELDKAMRIKVIQARRAAGENSEKLKQDEIIMRSYFGETLAQVGKILGKGKEATKKMRQRMIKKRSWSGVQKAITGMMDAGERGWSMIVKLPYRSACLVKLDIPETATNAEIDEAVNRSLVDEATRVWSDELARIGRNKMMTEEGGFTVEGEERRNEIFNRVRKAFKGGHLVGHFDCDGPGKCELCTPPAVASPAAAWLKGKKIVRTIIHTY